MEEVYEFLKKCGTFYIATEEGNQPRVRPFGVVNIFEGKLYIQTVKSIFCLHNFLKLFLNFVVGIELYLY